MSVIPLDRNLGGPVFLSDLPFMGNPDRRDANVLACEVLRRSADEECPEPGRPGSTVLCRIWPGPVDKDGYGRITDPRSPIRPRTRLLVHRVTAAFYVGADIGDEFVVHHLCHQKRCVEPRHFALLTPEEHADLHAWERRNYDEGGDR